MPFSTTAPASPLHRCSKHTKVEDLFFSRALFGDWWGFEMRVTFANDAKEFSARAESRCMNGHRWRIGMSEWAMACRVQESGQSPEWCLGWGMASIWACGVQDWTFFIKFWQHHRLKFGFLTLPKRQTLELVAPIRVCVCVFVWGEGRGSVVN